MLLPAPPWTLRAVVTVFVLWMLSSSPRAVSTVSGQCCSNGVVDASGLCCPSGTLDSFGVCDGLDATGLQRLRLSVSLPNGWTLANLTNNATARQWLSSQLVNHTGTLLGRDGAYVNVSAYSASRRLSAAEVWLRGLTVGGSAVAQVDLLPYGGTNNLPSTTLSTLLVGSSGSVTVSSLNSVTIVPVCGNGVCETGERPDPTNGVTGCPGDCPYPTGLCPEVNGQVGVGVTRHACTFVMRRGWGWGRD